MTNTIKNPSPLVETALKLDNYLSEIVRLGEKIDSMELRSDFDFEQVQKLMNRFTECGQGVAEEVVQLSSTLNQARAKAEQAAALVAAKAELLQARQEDNQKKMDDFRALGEKVRTLTLSLNDLKRPEGEDLSEEERAVVSMRLTEFQLRLQPLIDEALVLKKEAQASRLKTLESGADSLVQSLSAIGRRLDSFNGSQLASH